MVNKRRLFLLYAGCHLAFLIVTNALGSLAAYRAVYGTGQDTMGWGVEQRIQALLHTPPLRWYGLISGGSTSYGFFAPQVGTPVQSIFRLYDASGELQGSYRTPGLRHAASTLRYSVLLDVFHEAWHTGDSLSMRYGRAMVHCLAERFALRSGSHRITWQVYIPRLPTLHGRRYRLADSPWLILHEGQLTLHP